MTSVCQGLSSLAPGGSKMRDPGNEVGYFGVIKSKPNSTVINLKTCTVYVQ